MMNQDQVRSILETLETPPAPFKLIFSGRTSKKVNGLYKPSTQEIVIHNRNFDSDSQLLYTAIHEYAHHLLFVRKGGVAMPRPHTQEFWVLFHELLGKAEAFGYYRSIFEAEPAFAELTAEIKEKCLTGNGALLLELGRLLVRAEELCRAHHARFEDYVERVLGLPRKTATTAMHAQSMGLAPSLGWDGLQLVASLRDPEQRARAVEALASGTPPQIARRMVVQPQTATNDPVAALEAERHRLERSIATMQARLQAIEARLEELAAQTLDA
ncbi:MAG: hypothetical protein N2067_08100 [Spirochaetaceae bacterium]|nr:hypothetical protein [Spirochaetaceae bacterium]